jgi:hypothetical protein
MKKITWNSLDGKIPDCTLARLMDRVEEDTGKWPEWTDEIPEWVKEII